MNLINIIGVITLLALPVAALERQPEPVSPVGTWMDYFLKDGGRWLATNPTPTQGNPSPTAYAYAFSDALDRWIVNNQIIGVFGEREIVYWHTRFTWDPVQKAVRVHQAGYDGAFGAGIMRRVTDTELLTEMTITGPDGSSTRYRDRTVVVGPDEFTDISESLIDGKWVEQLRLTFKRRR